MSGTGVPRSTEDDQAPALFEQNALDGAAEVAVAVGEAGGGDADRIGAGPGLGVEQDPFADRLAREAQGQVAVDEGPLAEVEDRRGAVAEVGGDRRAHQRRDRRAFDDRPVGAIPDRGRAGQLERAACDAHRDGAEERRARPCRRSSDRAASRGAHVVRWRRGSDSAACAPRGGCAAPSRARLPCRSASRRIATSWIFFPSRRISVSIVSGATGTGRIRSTVRRATRIGTGEGRRSTAQQISEEGAAPCCSLGSHGPPANALVSTVVAPPHSAPSTR